MTQADSVIHVFRLDATHKITVENGKVFFHANDRHATDITGSKLAKIVLEQVTP
jgi:hypothetical protein